MYINYSKERFEPGRDLTAYATEAITGKTFVSIAGPLHGSGNISIKPAVAGDVVCGVAKYDAKAGDLVGVYRGASRVVTVTAASELTAGTAVEVGTNGQATAAATGEAVGYVIDDCAAGEDALVSLNR